MVECYYALYPIIRAYFLAAGRAVAKSHAVSLRTLGSDLRVCKGRFPRPWCCMLLADPKVPPISFVNTPCPAPVIRLKNPLYSPYSGIPCQHYGLFLKTTRRRQIDKATIDWKRHHGRKRISKVERLTVVARIKPTTIFDALYRIRTRSNYQDIDSFLFSNATAVDFSRLHAAICNITNYSLMMFETLIARMIGKKPFEAIVSGFLVSPLGSPGSQTIGLRCPIIKLLF